MKTPEFAKQSFECSHLVSHAVEPSRLPQQHPLVGLKIRDRQRSPQVGSSCFENSASDFSQFSLASDATAAALAAVPSRKCWFSLA